MTKLLQNYMTGLNKECHKQQLALRNHRNINFIGETSIECKEKRKDERGWGLVSCYLSICNIYDIYDECIPLWIEKLKGQKIDRILSLEISNRSLIHYQKCKYESNSKMSVFRLLLNDTK